MCCNNMAHMIVAFTVGEISCDILSWFSLKDPVKKSVHVYILIPNSYTHTHTHESLVKALSKAFPRSPKYQSRGRAHLGWISS